MRDDQKVCKENDVKFYTLQSSAAECNGSVESLDWENRLAIFGHTLY